MKLTNSNPGCTGMAVALVLSALATSGCLTSLASHDPEAMRRKAEKLSDEAVVLAVPLVYQTERFECGLSALKMLFAYYGKPVDRESSRTFAEQARAEEGIAARALVSYLKSQGMKAYLFEGELSAEAPTGLYTHLDKGRPLLVMIASGRDRHHYILLTGYDAKTGLVVTHDPVRGAVLMSDWQFNVLWKKCRNFTLLAVPADGATARTAHAGK